MRIETVGIVGAGTMGGGIAINLAQHGFRVVVHDARPELGAGRGRTASRFRRAVEKGRMTADAQPRPKAGSGWRTGWAASPRGAGDRGGVRGFRPQGGAAGARCRRCSPRRAGRHQHELPAGRRSRPAVGDPARFWAALFQPGGGQPDRRGGPGRRHRRQHDRPRPWHSAASGKTPCGAGTAGASPSTGSSAPTPTLRRALDDGLGSTAKIDQVARSVLGAAAGPFAVMNLIKPRINLHAIRNLAPLGTFYAPARAMIEAGEADRAFPIGAATALAADQERQIADRLLCGAFLPVLQAIDEGVAAPAVFDLGARKALDSVSARAPDGSARPGRGRRASSGRHRRQHGLPAPAALAMVGALTGRHLTPIHIAAVADFAWV